MSKNHFLQGALLLTIAALISRILGAVYRIPLKQLAGDSGLAIYGAVYPVFSTILILVVAGIPVTLSKLISEQLAIGNIAEEKRILRLALRFISILGVSFFFILFFSSSLIAKWIGIADAQLALQSVSFALLMIPILAVLRGFFYGHQFIAPAAMSQVVEQFFRVVTILILTIILVKREFTLDVVIAGATFGTVIGVALSTIYLGYKYVTYQRKRHVKQRLLIDQPIAGPTKMQLYKKIIFFTIAISASSLMIPLFGLADTFTGVNLLTFVANSKEEAQTWFGVYNRFLPFIQLTTIFATSLALSLVPKISESDAQQNTNDISHAAYLALKITVLLGLPASVGLALLTREVNVLFYGDELGSLAFAIISLASFFLTLAITTVAILQGLGKVYLPAVVLVAALLAKIGLNVVLIPILSITGLAVATFISYALIFFMNGFIVKRSIATFGKWSPFFLKPIIATALMGVIVFAGEQLIRLYIFPSPTRLQSASIVALLIVLGLVIYGITIILVKGITKQELLRIPKLGEKLVYVLEKFRLLKIEKAINS